MDSFDFEIINKPLLSEHLNINLNKQKITGSIAALRFIDKDTA